MKARAGDDLTKTLEKMNETHAVVRDGGQTIVIVESHDPMSKVRTIHRSRFADIKAFFNQIVIYEPRPRTLGDFWLSWPHRRQYEGVLFDPSNKAPKTYYNLWTGFSVEPKKGDWNLFQDHLMENICRNDVDLYLYVMAWLAQGVQHPEVRPEVALVLRSDERGTGKSLFARFYRQLFGHHGKEISNPQHLTGRFNAHLEDCCVLVLTEAFCTGSRSGESVLKALITEDTLTIEPKGFAVRMVPNYLRIIMTSNAEQVIPAGADERRFLVLDVDPKHKQDTAYFGNLVQEMERGGLAAMLYDLLDYDYSAIDIRTAPKTEALITQKLLSLRPHERWLFEKVSEGCLLFTHGGEWCQEVGKEEVYEDYCETMKRTGARPIITPNEMGKFLKRFFGEKLTGFRPHSQPRHWRFPALKECREIFEKRFGCIQWAVQEQPSADRLMEEFGGIMLFGAPLFKAGR